MDDDVVQYLYTLKKVNEGLLDALKTSVFVMQKWEDLTPERRSSMIDKIKGLIKQGEEAFEDVPTTH